VGSPPSRKGIWGKKRTFEKKSDLDTHTRRLFKKKDRAPARSPWTSKGKVFRERERRTRSAQKNFFDVGHCGANISKECKEGSLSSG